MPRVRNDLPRILIAVVALPGIACLTHAAQVESLEANLGAHRQLETQGGKTSAAPITAPQVSAPMQHVSLEKSLMPEEKVYYLKRAEELDPELVAAEITRFIWKAPFVSADLLAKDRAVQDAVFGALLGGTDAQIWTRREIAGILQSVFDAGKKDALRDKLKPQWGSEAPASQAFFEGKAGVIGPFEGGYRSEEWVNGFLIYAAKEGAEMLRAQTRDPGQTEREVRVSPGRTGTEPPNFEGHNGTRGYAYCGYSATGKCVVNGREVTNVFVEDGRVFAILVNTEKLNPQTNGCSTPRDCVDLVTIVDITDADKDGVPDDLHSKQLKIGANVTDVIDDREPGKRQYSLKFGARNNDTEIQLARTHDKFKDKVFKFSLNDLYSMRALHAKNTGDVMDIGGRRFYIFPMGGSRILCPGFTTEYCGAASQGYIPVEVADRVNDPGFHPRKLAVEYLAYTVVRRNGMDELVGNETSIGQIGGKWWWLSYDKDRQVFVPKEGLPPAASFPPAAQQGPHLDALSGSHPPKLDFQNPQLSLVFLQGDINQALARAGVGFRLYENPQAGHPKDRFHMVSQAGTSSRQFPVVKFVQDTPADPGAFRLGFLPLGETEGFLVAANNQGQGFIAVKGPAARQNGLNECYLQDGIHQVKVTDLRVLPAVLVCAQFDDKQVEEVLGAVARELESRPDLPARMVGNKRDGITLQMERENKRVWPRGTGRGTGKDTLQ